MTTRLSAHLPAILPWMTGASIAFIARMTSSFGGMNGYNADALAMYLFLAVSLMVVAWSQCVPLLLREGGTGRGALATRILPLAALSMASAMSGVFAFLLVRDF